jgi:hypothetical protein
VELAGAAGRPANGAEGQGGGAEELRGVGGEAAGAGDVAEDQLRRAHTTMNGGAVTSCRADHRVRSDRWVRGTHVGPAADTPYVRYSTTQGVRCTTQRLRTYMGGSRGTYPAVV